MSGKPSKIGIEDLITMLDREAALVAEWGELKPKADRMVTVEHLLADARRDIARSLEEMDIEGGGNAGWKDRMAWALAEMRRQVKAEARNE